MCLRYSISSRLWSKLLIFVFKESIVFSNYLIFESLALRVFYSSMYLLFRLNNSFFLVFERSFFFSNSAYNSLLRFWYFFYHSFNLLRTSSVSISCDSNSAYKFLILALYCLSSNYTRCWFSYFICISAVSVLICSVMMVLTSYKPDILR